MKRILAAVCVLLILVACIACSTETDSSGSAQAMDANIKVSSTEDAQTMQEVSSEGFFENSKDYIGQKIELTGKIYNQPENNQGILFFNLVSDYELQCVTVTYLDLNSELQLKQGDIVTVGGIVTEMVNLEDSKGRLVGMPMISAEKIDVTE